MQYTLIISSDADDHAPARRALGFARALMSSRSHSLKQVFFYAQAARSAMQDEHQREWRTLVSANVAELIICSASADRMGIDVAPEGFTLAGLGALIESGVESDRVLNFV